MLGSIIWLTVFIALIFYLLTDTSEKKIKRKIKRTLDFSEVSYQERVVDKGVDQENIPHSECFRVEEKNIESIYSGENMRYLVVSPRKHGSKEYPCIFLLHGLRDRCEDWIDKAKVLESYGELLKDGSVGEMILVMPDSGYNGESWYSDFEKDEQCKYESYIIKELIPEIKKSYPVLNMGIAGFSMGGHGAMKIALRNIECFKAVGSFAGAINLIRLAVNRRVMRLIKVLYVPEFLFGSGDKKHFVKVFGSWGYEIVRQDPYSLIKTCWNKNSRNLKNKYFYLSVGDQDREPYLMLQQWIDVVGRLKKYSFNYNAHLYQGESHSWDYVAKDFPNLLRYFYNYMK